MSGRYKTVLLVLLVVAEICTSVDSAVSENSVEERMSYKQFALIEGQESTTPRYPFADAQIPEEENDTLPSFEDWWIAKLQQQQINLPNLESIRAFTKASSRYILSSNNDMNILYSPINTWNYLKLLSSIAKGNSRTQVLNLLGNDSEEDESDDLLYNVLYWDDGFSVCRPASSIWINQHTQFAEALLSKLAKKSHTSVFQGPMGEDIYDVAFQSWLNDQTNGLLKEVVNDLGFDQETTISLCTSLYYLSSWSLPFAKDETYTDVFYTSEGEKKADFMKKEEGGSSIYLGTIFTSVIMDLQDGSYATFVLPDLGISIDDILQSEELYSFLFSGIEWSNVKKGRLKISMPKVDIMAATPMADLFVGLGITDVFDPQKAEFSSDIISGDKTRLTLVDQYSRLIMNENGIEAASIIVSDAASFRIPNEEEIDFTLNRPFIFVIFSETNIPLFFGVYNSP